MKEFRRIIAGLDLTEMDEIVIRYTEFLSKVFQPEKVYFTHVVPDLEIDKEFLEEFAAEPGLDEPYDEKVREALSQQVDRYFVGSRPFEVDYDVLEGYPFEQLLHWTKVKDADLLIVGRKEIGTGSGIVARRLARKADCSILFVPDHAEPRIDRILLPTDFSDDSARALLLLRHMAERIDNPEIVPFHVFDIPPGHFRISRSLEQFKNLVRGNAEEASARFLERCQAEELQPDMVIEPNDLNSPAKHIIRYSRDHAIDFIAIGARGHSQLDLIFLGSVAEKLIVYNDRVPMLILKEPKD